MTYAGDKSVEETWRALREDSSAVLVDVRTRAEWNFVGVPDLRETGKDLVTVEWQGFPDSTRNADFVAEVQQQVRPDQKVFLLCRSGARSRAAAIALTAALTRNDRQLTTRGSNALPTHATHLAHFALFFRGI